MESKAYISQILVYYSVKGFYPRLYESTESYFYLFGVGLGAGVTF